MLQMLPFLLSTDQRQKRSSTQDIKPFLNNIIFNTHKPTHVYEVALGGSVHETGIRWDVHTFPLVGHTQNL